jgi:hypothetical protein
MSEKVAVEILIITRAVFMLLIGGGFGFIIWMLKRGINKINEDRDETNKKIEEIEEKHTNCRDTLDARFAEKKRSDDTAREIFKRLTQVQVDIAFIKGRVNGGVVIHPPFTGEIEPEEG